VRRLVLRHNHGEGGHLGSPGVFEGSTSPFERRSAPRADPSAAGQRLDQEGLLNVLDVEPVFRLLEGKTARPVEDLAWSRSTGASSGPDRPRRD
jgi:hypothetical protein